jgi:hypothetical protein
VVVWVCWRASGERRSFPECWRAAQQRCCRSSCPLAGIGLWQLLIMVRPGYATLFMGDPIPAGFVPMGTPRRLPSRSCLAWYLTLRRWIGATALAIGALLGPAILGLVTAWLLPAMSYYGSLAVIGAGGGA